VHILLRTGISDIMQFRSFKSTTFSGKADPLMKTYAAPLMPLVCCALLTACATRTLPSSPGHVTEPPPVAGSIPEPVQQSAALRPPTAAAKLETYSVSVHKVPVQSMLFALARDAGMNIDIHSGIEGTVTLNAIDQTLPQLMTRIASQVDMRFEIDGKNLVVMPDSPVWRTYKVDYVNIARSTSSSVNIATQISTAGAGGGSSSSSQGSGTMASTNSLTSTGSTSSASGGTGSKSTIADASNGNNNSTTAVANRSDNNFWASLEKNIRDMLRESSQNDNAGDAAEQQRQQIAAAAAAMPTPPGQMALTPMQAVPPMQAQQQIDANAGGSRRNSSAVIVNAETGLIAVRATGRQHEKIREFMDLVLDSAKRQVLIEATIIEVKLSDTYQQGINWSRLNSHLNITQGQVGTTALSSAVTPGASQGLFTVNLLPGSKLGNISATIQLLESFGKVKVLSSPKISVLNNQTALLKVVDNNVFFTIKVTPATIGVNGNVATPTTYESQLETVPVGFVMSVTPQISDRDQVTLNVRPTITRIVSYVNDPNPLLASAGVISQIPVIQARELESIMKVDSGQIAVMGGLMQDSADNSKDGVPGLSSLPLIGNLFTYRNEASTKTELVIFMRPVVVKDASVNGDYKDYRYLLPDGKPINSDPYFEEKTVPLLPSSTSKANGS
jgi:general secretion pathway protein D